MNWKKIKETAPKAFDKFLEFFYEGNYDIEEIKKKNYPPVIWDDLSHIHLRILYDFFDGYEIHGFPVKGVQGWQGEIIYDDERWFKHYYKTRAEVEELIFNKCFYILEGRL